MNYKFEDLRADLAIGHELDFFYEGQKYSISANESGWFLTRYNDQTDQSFETYDDLLQNATIDSKHLKEIWDQIVIDYIY